MATDSTNLPQGETTLDAGMTGSDLDHTTVQEVANEPANYVDLPKGNTVILLPVQPGQTVRLPTDSTDGVLAKIGPEGNLALVIDGRTIILQGFLKANDQSPIKIVTNDGDAVNVAELVAATDPSLDIQTAAGPASGDQGDTDGSGIYIPFLAGPGLGGILAEGILDPTALQYRNIDDDYILFTEGEEDRVTFDVTFDVLGGIVNEDDLPAGDGPGAENPQQELASAKFVLGGKGGHGSGMNGEGNDPFDTTDREDEPGDEDGVDDNGNEVDPDREPLETVATIKAKFPGSGAGTLTLDLNDLPTELKSHGELVSFEFIPGLGGGDLIRGFVDGGGDPTKFDHPDDRLVLTVEADTNLSPTGEFHVTFTLWDQIDHTTPQGLIGANEQIADLPVHFTLSGGGATADGTLPLGIEDDIPFFGKVIGCEIPIDIVCTDVEITHDETPGVQPGSDDVSVFNPWVFWLGVDVGSQVDKAGFEFPFGESEGSLVGAAKTKVHVSFGADGPTVFIDTDDADPAIRNSVFGALQDKSDGVIDDKLNDAGPGLENEHPFELFMVKDGTAPGSVTEGDLTIADQKTNATVTWGGTEPPTVLEVYVQQIDANTVVGYVQPDGPDGDKVAVFALNIDDSGCLSFFQIHQLNHNVDGPTFPDHDDPFTILGEDGTPLIYVRATDYDGDHAIAPVNLEVQDDGPKFCTVDWGHDNDSKHGVGLIDEDKLDPNGNNDWAPGDDKGGTHTDGKIIFDFGVDEPGHLEVKNLTVRDSAGNVLLNLTVDWATFDPIDGSIDVTGLNNLKTADGDAVTVTATLDPVSGLLTIVGEDADGNPAFTFKLDTSGADVGEFDFCLDQPLYHPYTDLDSKNDGPLKAFEDNLKFDFKVQGFDSDGDFATGHIKVNVDDDSPKAECDVDCVTEGKTDGELNFASGNVVTGNPPTAFDDDANHLDGNADAPGADQPYTISKLEHCGSEYVLVQEGDGTYHVEKGGVELPAIGDESFDPATGILTIPSHEGGSFEIVMVSDDQSKVGDYKYTVPENADHDVDKHFGPESLAESVSGDFDSPDDWVDSFGDHGITLAPIGGSLTVKDINVQGGGSPDYRGVGVANYPGDESEVDRGGNEGLKLTLNPGQFPFGANNIALTIGALFDGTQYDNTHQEILQWVAYGPGNIVVGSGQILGNNDGVVTVDIDTLLPFTRIELKPIDNGQGDEAGESFGDNSDFLLINAEICCPQDKFTEQFEYTLRDADGDESCATLKVDVKDTEPTHENPHTIITTLLVDEDGLPNGVGNTDSPFDNEEDHGGSNAPVDDAVHFGTIPFTPGADPTSIELTVFGGPDTGLKTLDNKKIFAAWDSTLKALIGYVEGTDPNDAANQVFKMTILDPLTGAYSFELLQAVKHDNTDIFGAANDTENVLNTPANFIVVAEIEDKDCDVIFSKVIVSIDDDMPVITPCYERGDLLVNGSFEDLGTEDGGTLENGNWGVFSQIPGWKSGADEANPSGLPGLEIQAGAVIAAKDGNNYVELDSDNLDQSDPAPSTTNASIYQDVTTNDGDNYVLSFSYSPRTGDENSDGIEVWFDGQLVTTLKSGTVGEWTDYTFVVKAGEGDGTPDLSRLEFKAIGSADELGGFIDDVSLTSCAIVDEDALPNGIEGGPGDDGPIGACFSGNLGVNFGADGGKSIVFNTTGQPTLFSHGVQVKYAWDNATQTLIGYTGANVPANWVFTVKVETLDNGGEYKFTLLKPLDHPDTDNIPNNENDHGNDSFEDNLIFDLKFKATDRDDDTVEGKLRINVDDDSPSGDLVKIKVDKYGDGALVHDETKGIDNPDDVAGPLAQFAGLEGSEGITAIGYAKTSVNVDLSGGGGNPNAAYGADGPGTTALSLTGPGGLPFSGAATNLFDTASGEPIFLYTEGGLVVGRIGSGGSADAGGDVSFALSIDNAGNLSVAQYRAIQHPDETNPDDSVTLLAAGGEDAIVHITAKITDYDGDAVTVTVPLDGEEGGNGAIKFEDDGPTATCDYDCVVEGKNDNVPNSAIGNVVTGANATIFGSDGNPFDGNPDNPGVDGPYTISKLAHGGTTYYLNDLGGGVFSVTEGAPAPAGTPIDGVTETFDGKTLKIPSAEGGTFEIVMVSPTQAEVGDYKYTVPCDADHAHDKHFGPESLAETRSEAFDHVDEWTAAFSADGITLTNLGGTGFAIKDIDVNPKAGFGGAEDYRGIGISGGIDGGEVDTHQETMQLQFATPTDNAEVQIGAFFDGTQFDNGFQEIIQWKALAADGVTVIASGQILGSDNGLVTLDIDTNGVDFSYIQLTPLNNGAGGNSGNNSDFVLVNVEVCCPEDKFQEQFDYTLRDGDGDESTATLKIDVKDTKPTIPHDGGPLTLCLTVDEDGLPAGVGNDFPVGSPNDAPGNSASAIGFIPFTPGADPVTIELSVGNGGDTGLQTLAGQTVLAAWDAESSTLIGYIAGTDPSDAANQVFKMSVTDAQTGAVTFDLLKPIKHADGGQDDNTENWPDPTLTVNVQIEDKDCDVAFTTVTVKIDDDMPVFKHLRADGDGITIHDETPGLQDDDQPLGSLPSYFKGLFNAGPAIGWAEDGESGVSVSVDFGADGPASSGSIQYDLSLTSNAGVDSGLKTTAGLSIWLFQEGDIVVGRVGSGATGETPNSGGAVALAVAIQDDGDLQVAPYLALKHPNTSDHDEDISISLAALQAKVTATDKDGDSVSQTVDIGTLIKFDDDGPNARDDFDNIQTNDGDNFFAAGNVITGASTISPATGSDIVGADTPGKITGVSGAGGVDVDPAGDFVVQGLYGKLTMKENGDYEYDLDEAKIGSIPSGATEQFNYRLTDGDGDNDVAKLTIKFPEAKIPKTEIGVGPNMNGTMKEDVSSPIYFEVDPQQSSDTVVHVKITGLIGWNLGVIDGLTVDILGPAVDSNITFDPVTGILEFDVTGAGAGNTITGFFNAIPPQDTDLDQPLAIEATVQDGPITAVGTDTTTVKVDAILDEYVNVEGADKSGLESVAAQSINLGLTAAFQSSGFANALAGGSDTDGSESHAVKLVFSAPLPLGTVVEFGLAFGTVALDVTDPSGKTYLVLPNTLGDLDDLVASIGLTLPAGFDGTISGQIQSASEEANTPPPVIPGNAEITNADNTKTDSANFSVTITPDVTVEALAAVFSRGGNYLKEDQRSVLTLTAIPGDGDVVTQIKLTNVPDGWDVASPFFCDNGSIVGAPVFDPVSHSITFDVTGATAGVSVNISVGLTAAADSDVDGIGLVVSATAQQGAVIATDDTTFDVTVDAVLDQYVDVSNSANTVDETVAPQVVSLNLTSTMTGGVSNPFPQSFEGTAGPDGDGSEEAGVIISVNGPANAAGVDLVFTGAVPAGVTLTEDPVDSGSWRLTGNSAADVQTALSQVGASLPAGFDGTVTGSITAITYEHNTPPSSIELASGNEPDIGDNVKVDQAEYTLTVNESDKAPINYNDAKSGDEPGQGQNNVMIIFDHSTSMDVDADGDGPGTASRLQLARAAVEALLNKFDLLGDVKVNMVIFATNATAMTFWGTVAEALAFLDDPANHNPLGSFTSYSDALAAAGAGLTTNTTGMLVGPDVTNTVYFLSDGIPTADGATSGTDNDDPHNLTVAQQTAWNTALETANVDKVFAVGVGEGIPAGDPDLEAVANPGGNPNNDPVGTVVIVTDENDLAAVLTDTVEGDPIEGNVLDGSIEVEVGGTPDNPGDAPAHIAYFSYTDPNGAVNGDKSITFTWDGNVLNALGVSGPAVPISITNQIAVFLTENGKMTFYFKDGSGHLAGDFEFIPNSISGSADATETFKYYTRDLDGDTEAGAPGDGSPGAGGATLIITINNINQGPVAVNDSANGTEGQVVTIPFASLLGNDTDPDGDSLTIQSVQGAVNGSVVIDGTDVKFTPNAGYFGPASFTYTINDGSLLTSTATVNLLIASNNVAPVGNIDHIYTNSDDDVTVQSAWLLVNDTDADGDPLKITSVDENTNKIASLNEGGLPTSFIFNLSNDNTSDGSVADFTYDLNDGEATTVVGAQIHLDQSGGVINGSAGNDIILAFNAAARGGAGDDRIVGYGSFDTLDYSDIGGDWNLTLGAGGNGTATVLTQGTDTYQGIENLMGGSGKNELTGNTGSNFLTGNGGDDKLDGGNDAVADTLSGGDGNDTLIWRDNADTYSGGANGDILDVSGTASINFTNFSDSKIESIETLKLLGGSGTAVTLNAGDVINFEGGTFDPVGSVNTGSGLKDYDSASVLKITGEAGDTVNLTSGGSDTWFNAETNGATGVPAGFTLYVHVTSGANPAFNENAYVLVQDAVTVNLS